MTMASVITFTLATALSLPQGYWAVLTAVIVTQGSVGSSLKAAIERLGGSICGACAGASIALAMPHQTPVLLCIALAVATAPLAGLAAFVPGFRIAPVTAIIVLLSTTSATLGPIGYAADRILEIALGSLVGLVVSTLVRPVHAHDLALDASAEVASLLAIQLRELSRAGRNQGPDLDLLQAKTRKALNKLEALAEEAARERRSCISSEPDPEPLFRTLRRLCHDTLSVNRALHEPWPDIVHQHLIEPWSRVADASADVLEELARVLPTRQIPRAREALPQAIAEYVTAVETVRRKGLTQHLPAEIASRVFVVVVVIEQLSQNLNDMIDRSRESARSV